MTHRPAIVLAMLDGMRDYACPPALLDRLDECGEILDRAPLANFDDERALELLARAEVLVGHWGCPTLTDDVLARAPHLQLFAYGAGTVKWQVTEAVFDRGIVVTSAAAANARPVAEYTVAMILLANKGVFAFRELLRAPKQPGICTPAVVGNAGKYVGIVGASHVGRIVIELLRSYELEVGVYDPFLSAEGAAALGVELVSDLDELCARSDVLSLHAPDIPATRGMLGANQFAAMRDGSTFVNTARPALVDQDALLAELRSGRISAILDVAEPDPLPAGHELLAMPNVFVTPHVAGSMGNEVPKMTELAVEEVERWVRGEPPRYPVTRSDLDRIA